MRTRRGQRLAVAACGLAALAAPLAITASAQNENGGSTAGGNGGQVVGHTMQATIPAQLDQRPQGFVSTDVVRPIVNAWRMSSRRRLTEVDAGALARDKSTGVFAIFRHEFRSIDQDVTLVEVKDSGPLEITRAPVGPGVQDSAQRNAKIGFAGARGVRGTLQLRNEKVTLRKR
jgi:hypothetical protein